MIDESATQRSKSPKVWDFGFGREEFLDLFGDLLSPMTQDQSSTYISPDGARPCSVLDLFKVWGRMYELRNLPGLIGERVESARKFTINSIRDYFPNTQTRIIYSNWEGENDEIIQDYGTPKAVSRKVNFVGESGRLEKFLSLEASMALTGKTPEETAEIIRYLTGTLVYISKTNYITAYISKAYNINRPQCADERVVRLAAYPGRFSLFCNGNPQVAVASFRVRTQKNFGVK